jgi:hypothetical protein
VLLLDPTVDIQKSHPLWGGYRNWDPTPPCPKPEAAQAAGTAAPDNSSAPQPPATATGPATAPAPAPVDEAVDKNSISSQQHTFFNDFIYWATRPEVFESSPPNSNIHVPIQALLHLVGSEWLTIVEYVKTRLNQIDWEIAYPQKFADNHHVDIALKRLHTWRRLVPLYREMLSETLDKVFDFPCHIETFPGSSSSNDLGQETMVVPDGKSSSKTSPLGQGGGPVLEGSQKHIPSEHQMCPCPHKSPQLPLGAISKYRHDFVLVLSYMQEYQKRIDRLTSVVTAVISIDNSSRAMSDNRKLGRLTWLATFFLPFNLVAATFCMQAKVTDITNETVKWYFTVSVPFAVTTLIIALAISSIPKWRAYFKHKYEGHK